MNDETNLHDIAKPASEKLDAVTLIAAESIQRLWVYNRQRGEELHRRLLDALNDHPSDNERSSIKVPRKTTLEAMQVGDRSGRSTTARRILEARLGRVLGPIATMPRDLRRALYLLARQINKHPRNPRQTPRF